MRYYAIGDIHGHKSLIERLLVKIDKEAAKQESKIVFLGDYVDRGPEIFETVEFLSERMDNTDDVFLMGNHDLELHRASVQDEWDRRYDAYGSCNDETTIRSYKKMGYDVYSMMIPQNHIDFYRRLRTHYDTEKAFFVHAGVDPDFPFLGQSVDNYLWIRKPFLLHRGPFEKIVVHGHTITRDRHVNFDGLRLSVDTGAFDSGRLSCAVVEDGKWIDTITVKDDEPKDKRYRLK